MNKIFNIIRNIISLICCVVLFAILCLYMLLNVSTKIINKDNVVALVSALDVVEIFGNDITLFSEHLYEEAKNNNIDSKTIDQLLNSKELKSLLGNNFGNIIDAILYNKKVEPFGKKEVTNAIKSFLNNEENEVVNRLSEEDKEVILNAADKEINVFLNIVPTYDEVAEGIGSEGIEALRFLFGNSLKFILLIILIFITGIIVISQWSIYKFAIWTGITTAIAGGLYIVLAESSISMYATDFSHVLSTTMFSLLKNNVLEPVKNLGIVVFIIGIIEVIYYFIMKQIHSKEV